MATSWLQFDLGERSFAIPLDAVAEVMWAQHPHLIPLVPPNVGGVLNIRGEPLVVMNGGAVFGLEPAQEAQDASAAEAAGPELHYSHVLLLEHGDSRIGLRVGHVSRIDRDRAVWTGREENVNEEYPFVREVHRANGTLGLVDLDGFLERATALLTQSRAHQGGQESCLSAF